MPKVVAPRKRFPNRNGNSNGNGTFPTFTGPAPQVHTKPAFYDYTLSKEHLQTKNNTDAVFEKEVIDRSTALQLSEQTSEKIVEFTKKVIAALNLEKEQNTVPDVVIEQIAAVGSLITKTAIISTEKSDIVVQLSTLPSFETVSALGNKVADNIKSANGKDVCSSVAQDYGCCIMSPNVQVRILITILPENSTKLEPGLHLNNQVMMINFFSMRHMNWFISLEKSDEELYKELIILIRVLKDVRNRFPAIQPLSIWALQYLAFYCLANGPNRQRVNLGTAFRRFFEVIAAGIFLPRTPVLLDPMSTQYRIGFDLTYAQMDVLCMAAQTLVRIFATGNDGYRAILGTLELPSHIDMTRDETLWHGITIKPSKSAFTATCMEPYLPEEGKEEK